MSLNISLFSDEDNLLCHQNLVIKLFMLISLMKNSKKLLKMQYICFKY